MILQAYFEANANGEMFLTYPHTVRRIAARGTAHTLRRLVQIQPERGKARISAKSNIPTLINDTGGIISIAKQHLRKFHH